MQSQIGINGMHCASCSANVERTLSGIVGVQKAHVNLALEEALVEYDDRKVKIETLHKAITDIGFSIRETIHLEEDEHIKRMHIAKQRMILSWVITFIVLLFMIPHMAFSSSIIGHKTDAWIMFMLSLFAMAVPARHVYISAYKSASSGNSNMDVLIALGTISSLMVSPLSLFIHSISPHDFAGIAAMILSFHLTGRYLENRAKGKASEAIRKLINLGAKTALMLVDGVEKEVPVHKITNGDVFIVKPGSKIPTDGIIISGSSTIDESIATGESMPVLRMEGDSVLGATINLDGYFQASATKVGSETFLAQVIKMVSEAQHSKVPIQLLADRVTAIFVPAIIALTLVVFSAWVFAPESMSIIAQKITAIIPLNLPASGIAAAFMAAIATLVIACPCALGLATPTALMVGSGIGANKGILIRSGEALQKMKDVDTIVFDKTGTLTHGKPELLKIQSVLGSDSENLTLAYSLELASEHPLASAINNAAISKHLKPLKHESFISIPGKGVSATISGSIYYLGSLSWLKEIGISETAVPEDSDLSYAGKMYLSDSTQLLAMFYVADSIREEAKQMIQSVRKMGITPFMMSGDNEETALKIAEACGITSVLARVMPADKAARIKELQESGKIVAMVGDGINDAPALKQADIGIAMGKGTDVAIEASDITLLRGDLNLIPTALTLSIETFRKIRQNLFWAFFYNIVSIPLAAFGVLHPVIAELAMAISSITVVTNANMLKAKYKDAKISLG